MQSILICTKHNASDLQLQIGCTGPSFATTKCRAQLDLSRTISKTIQDMHYKKLCV